MGGANQERRLGLFSGMNARTGSGPGPDAATRSAPPQPRGRAICGARPASRLAEPVKQARASRGRGLFLPPMRKSWNDFRNRHSPMRRSRPEILELEGSAERPFDGLPRSRQREPGACRNLLADRYRRAIGIDSRPQHALHCPRAAPRGRHHSCLGAPGRHSQPAGRPGKLRRGDHSPGGCISCTIRCRRSTEARPACSAPAARVVVWSISRRMITR